MQVVSFGCANKYINIIRQRPRQSIVLNSSDRNVYLHFLNEYSDFNDILPMFRIRRSFRDLDIEQTLKYKTMKLHCSIYKECYYRINALDTTVVSFLNVQVYGNKPSSSHASRSHLPIHTHCNDPNHILPNPILPSPILRDQTILYHVPSRR